MRILHLEDEPLQREIAHGWMAGAGHEVDSIADGESAIKAVERGHYDVAILDLDVPGAGGEEVLRWIRERRPAMPVIFATATEEEAEVARILGLGADDYMIKPLRRLEFLARIDAAGRRSARVEQAEGEIDAPPYRVDFAGRAVYLSGEAVDMTPRVLELAFLFFRRRGQLVTRAEMYERVWGRREKLETRTLDTHVSKLRSVLGLDGRHGWRLVSVYQHGYRLQADAKG